jgi:flagellar basal body-associated protein FliL
MPAKRKKATKSPTIKAKVDNKVAEKKEEATTKPAVEKKASFKVVETKPAEEEPREKTLEVEKGKTLADLEASRENVLSREKEETEEAKPKKESSGEIKAETYSKIPSITSFSQLDSQNSAPANSDPLPDEKGKKDVKVEEIKKEEKAAGDNEETKETGLDKMEERSDTEDKKEKEKKNLSSEDVKEWLKDVRPDTTKEVEKGRGPALKIVLTITAVLAVLGIIAGGVYYYQTGFNKEAETTSDEQEQVEAPDVTEAPEPTPEDVDLSEFSVNILNGSGIAGEAGKVDALLTELSFKETDTGNADSYDYTTTIVSLKESVSDEVYNKIKEALTESYMIEKSDETLEEDSAFDVKIIVGSKKAE